MYIFLYFPAGPNNASLNIQPYYDLCPSNTQPIEMNCSLDFVHPSANFTIAMETPDNITETQCVPVSRNQCTHHFMPTTNGTHRFQCHAENILDSSLNASSPEEQVYVRGNNKTCY